MMPWLLILFFVVWTIVFFVAWSRVRKPTQAQEVTDVTGASIRFEVSGPVTTAAFNALCASFGSWAEHYGYDPLTAALTPASDEWETRMALESKVARIRALADGYERLYPASQIPFELHTVLDS
jgi:hypothetical protein